MKLSQLLKYNQIIVQCHDNPDADAIAMFSTIWAT